MESTVSTPGSRTIVRKGTGITGKGVAHISPKISGRLTLRMLQKMKKDREDDEFALEDENEF